MNSYLVLGGPLSTFRPPVIAMHTLMSLSKKQDLFSRGGRAVEIVLDPTAEAIPPNAFPAMIHTNGQPRYFNATQATTIRGYQANKRHHDQTYQSVREAEGKEEEGLCLGGGYFDR
jgi:hypothetical protein